MKILYLFTERLPKELEVITQLVSVNFKTRKLDGGSISTTIHVMPAGGTPLDLYFKYDPTQEEPL